MSDDQVLHVHGDSVRVGIRLAVIRYTNKLPPEDQVRMIQDTRPPNVVLSEFSMIAITNMVRERQERRRQMAKDAMTVILARSASEFTSLSQEEIERIAMKAWQMAAAMEAQESVSASLDTMDPAKK